MCTFENEQSIVVCDIAIQKVREATSQAFGDAVQFTPVKGAGTWVEALPTVATAAFQEVTRQAIAATQRKNTTSNQEENFKRAALGATVVLPKYCKLLYCTKSLGS